MNSMGWRTGFKLMAAAALGVMFAGCSSDGLTGGNDGFDDAPEMVIDLGDAAGGMDSGDESPAFGDGYISSQLTGDEPVTVAEELPEEEDMGNVFFLRAVWGRVTEAPETTGDDGADCGSLVWDGGLEVSDGVIRPVSTIRFERRGPFADSLIFPRENKAELNWGSTTGCGRDGVLIAILIPPPGDSLGNGDGLTDDDMVTFSTGPLTASFRIKDLAQLDSLIMVDDNNGVVFTGFDRDDVRDVCARGAITGVWARAENDDGAGGYFRAVWLNPVGVVWGHVRGRWGVHDGRRLFVGKVINRGGGYEGHIRGTWHPAGTRDNTADHPNRDGLGRAGGTFHGKWIVVHPDQPEVAVGGLHGRYGIGQAGRGLMVGRWASRCNPNTDDDYGDDGNDDGSDSTGDAIRD